MLHPNQFEINEAWIAFWLNDEPSHTARDGSFNCICIMDAASCYILGHVMTPAHEAEPSHLEAEHLLKAGWEHKKEMPRMLFVPKDQFEDHLTAAAQNENIDVVPVAEQDLLVFIEDARKAYKAHVRATRSQR